MTRYDPKAIEEKWRERWLREKTYEPDLKGAKRPFYNLMMFPYPSAEGLHVGNMYAFAGADIYGRKKRMEGYDVFEPIGLDGFGIHSENYALSIGRHPADQAKVSEENFYRQLSMIGNGFAWSEHLETYDPEYYKWTQWIFVQMFKRGLAYRKKQAVNWCPSCKTVLADEQVISGECERCGSKVEKRELEQWFFKITDYAERLIKNLETIDWSERIKVAQRNWIGRSEGALIEFPIQNSKFKIQVFTTRPDTLFGATYMVLGPEHTLIQNSKFKIQNWQEVERYITAARAKSEADRIAEGREKTGVELKGVKAINPANGEEIPVWVADYVLGDVGTGAIMAVPAHDERDFEFAKKYTLPIAQVIAPHFEDENSKRQDGYPLVKRRSVYCILRNPKTDEFLTLDWGEFGWHTFIIGGIEENEDLVIAAKREIEEETGYENVRFVRKLGRLYGSYFAAHKKENRLADAEGLLFELVDDAQRAVLDREKQLHAFQWMKAEEAEGFISIGSQRYIWEQYKKESAYTGSGFLVDSDNFSGAESDSAKRSIVEFIGGTPKITYRLRDWLISRQRYWGPPIPMVFCEACRAAGKGEREDMPGWYAVAEKDLPVKLPYIENFRPTGTDQSPLAAVKEFYQTTCPSCGSEARRETDVSDTFLDSAWYYIGYLAKENSKFEIQNSEFRSRAKRWLPVDMYIGGAEHAVLHLLYVRFLAMAFHDWGLMDFDEPFKKFRAHGLLIKDGAKMSKSRGNVVNPDEYVKAYGADALRMYLMFLGPFEQGGDFTDTGIRGITRFLERVWKFFRIQNSGVTLQEAETSKDLERVLHRTIKKVTEDIEGLQYNTAISALMTLLNACEKHPAEVNTEHRKIFLKLLAPFAPHIAEELWREALGEKESIHVSAWPEADSRLLTSDTEMLIVQVNGRVRDRIEVASRAGEEEVRKSALAQPKVREVVGDRPVKRFVYVPGRIVNIVV